MGCVGKETLYAYAEDELSPEEKQRVSVHLSTCAQCRGELLLLRRIDDVLAEEPLLEPAPAFTRNVMARVALRPKWVAYRWYYIVWAALTAMGVGLSLRMDWGADLGRTSERLWIWVEDRVAEAITSMGTGLDRAMGHLTGKIEAWGRWVNDGLQAAGHVGQYTWFVPFAMICLIGWALYEFLDSLYEDRRPNGAVLRKLT